jgi:hypothetical protein
MPVEILLARIDQTTFCIEVRRGTHRALDRVRGKPEGSREEIILRSIANINLAAPRWQ